MAELELLINMQTGTKIALVAIGTVLGVEAIAYGASRASVYSESAPITNPPKKTSIVLAAWYETNEHLETSLGSLRNQNIIRSYPDRFEIITVGCDGVDMVLAASFSDKTICAPKGKLNARDQGIREAQGDVIVAVDADTYYPPNWLNKVLAPFNDPKVVAVETWTEQSYAPVLTWIGQPLIRAHYSNRMLGRGSAFRRKAYFDLGGFNLKINQRDMGQMLREEEYQFKQRLQALGKVAFVDAPEVHLVTVGTSSDLRRGLHTGN